MSKRRNKKVKVETKVTTNKVEQPDYKVVKYYKTEEDEMNEKKGFINGLKEFGKKVPKPVKVVGGILGAGAAITGVVVGAISVLSKDDDGYSNVDLPEDDFEITTDEASTDVAEETTGTTEEA